MKALPRSCALLLAVCAACTVGPGNTDGEENTGGPIVDFPGDGSEPPREDDDEDSGDGDGDLAAGPLDAGFSTGSEDSGVDGSTPEFPADGGPGDGGSDDAGDGMIP